MDRLESSLRLLVQEFGLDAVKQKLVCVGKPKRRRGRPAGRSKDDSPLLQQVAKLYRDAGGDESVGSIIERVAPNPADARRLYRRLQAKGLSDKIWLYQQELVDLHEAVAGRNKVGDPAEIESWQIKLSRLRGQWEKDVRFAALTAMLNCTDKVNAEQIWTDVGWLLILVTDCEVYQAEADRLRRLTDRGAWPDP